MKTIILFMATTLLWTEMCSQQKNQTVSNPDKMTKDVNSLEVATLGGGCFWCVEAVFQELKGIEKVVSGFSGGHVKNPSYKEVTRGTTGHAEVCQIHFDPAVISYDEILEIFWTTHDPTTLNRQGNDAGPQYRSIILYNSEHQRQVAIQSKKEVAPHIWKDPIVTEIQSFERFYEAEEYHQDFYSQNPNYGYCRVIINPKVAKVRAKFADKLKVVD